MNTHDIELPPLPVAVPWHKGYDRESLESYARAAVESAVLDWKKDAERLDGLIELCGHVQDGSDSVVRIFQDDATREWIVRIGDLRNGVHFHGSSPRAAIDAAMENQK